MHPANAGQVDADGCGLIYIGGMCGGQIAATLLEVSDPGWTISRSGNNFSCMHCQPSFFVEVCYSGSEAKATAYIEFRDTEFSGSGSASIICTIKANCCELATAVSYSSGNPATIAPSAQETITVDDGCSPFTWTVSGTGFSFAVGQTTTPVNTLVASASACSAAIVDR